MTESEKPLRFGWTTGACAAAATAAAHEALSTGRFPEAAEIPLPRGGRARFLVALAERGEGFAAAGVVKDAGDDPDVTHGALIIARLRPLARGAGVVFRAGEGVGTITLPGLPLPPGEPAINPVPREMMRAVTMEGVAAHGGPADVEIEISIPGGAEIARRTWNPRLGILGGLSILGTTGIVRPFSCSAWIASIHRGIDVARANGLTHVLGATGAMSEQAAQKLYGLPEQAILDMGDFAGGLLKYLRDHPIERLTLAGGFAKMLKLGQGAMDLHSDRSQVDFARLAEMVGRMGGDAAAAARANSALEVLQREGPGLAILAAQEARRAALEILRGAPVAVDAIITDRAGAILAHEPSTGPSS